MFDAQIYLLTLYMKNDQILAGYKQVFYQKPCTCDVRNVSLLSLGRLLQRAHIVHVSILACIVAHFVLHVDSCGAVQFSLLLCWNNIDDQAPPSQGAAVKQQVYTLPHINGYLFSASCNFQKSHSALTVDAFLDIEREAQFHPRPHLIARTPRAGLGPISSFFSKLPSCNRRVWIWDYF